MKYAKRFKSLHAAKSETLYSPAVITVTENERTVVAMKDLGTPDIEMCVPERVQTLDEVIIVRKSGDTFKLSESKLNTGAVYA